MSVMEGTGVDTDPEGLVVWFWLPFLVWFWCGEDTHDPKALPRTVVGLEYVGEAGCALLWMLVMVLLLSVLLVTEFPLEVALMLELELVDEGRQVVYMVDGTPDRDVVVEVNTLSCRKVFTLFTL